MSSYKYILLSGKCNRTQLRSCHLYFRIRPSQFDPIVSLNSDLFLKITRFILDNLQRSLHCIEWEAAEKICIDVVGDLTEYMRSAGHLLCYMDIEFN